MNHSLYRVALERFVKSGYLAESSLRQVDVAGSSPPLISYLRQGSIPESVFAQTMQTLFQVPLLAAQQFPDTPVANTLALSDFLHQQEVLPIELSAAGLRVAMVDPSDEFSVRVLRSKCQCAVNPVVALRSELLAGLSRLYPDVAVARSEHVSGQQDITDIENDSSVVTAVHRLMQRAIAQRASDIHFEPSNRGLRVRFRVLGTLQHAADISEVNVAPTIARLKLMAGLDVTQRRLPQDGRFKFPSNGQKIDMRVSTMPLHNGESIVIRLLDADLGQASLKELGYRASVIDCLSAAMSLSEGLVLLTGPTGSGKSTTLYSFLNQLDLTALKVISIEDPVEIAMDGVNQIQVDDEFGVGFAQGLRSVLRQDPDVIMVGEIRDPETAQLAIQAALTGHLVLSTLHTNNAAETVLRLRDLGLADYLIEATVKLIVAQRLVKLRCDVCGFHTPSTDCQRCHGSGYRGRCAIAEVLPAVSNIDWQVGKTALSAACESKLLDGMCLADDAARLLALGSIDEAEMTRVLGLDTTQSQN